MLIHESRIIKEKNKVIVKAKIEFDADLNFPKDLFFEIYDKRINDISKNLDPFLVAVFLIGMRLGENIMVKGFVSESLLNGIYKYQQIFHDWFPDEYKMVKIITLGVRNCKNTGNRGVATTFSGGIDSLYTLKNYINTQQNDKNNLSHALFVHGFDTNMNDFSAYNTAKEVFDVFLKKQNIELLSVRTNLRKFTDNSVEWDYAHGTGITAVALLFTPVIKELYIASTYSKSDLHPWGSHPDTDPLLHTECFNIIHHGINKTRVEKTISVARWADTYNVLRVCGWLEGDGLKNCGRCSKCLRTMITLDLAGTLNEYTTFATELTRAKTRKGLLIHEGGRMFAKEIIEYARKQNRKDIVFDLNYALVRSYIPSIIYKYGNKFRLFKKMLNGKVAKRVFFFLSGK